jgi:hypothetical protein
MNATATMERHALTELELEPAPAARSVPTLQPEAQLALADASPAGVMLKALGMGATLEQVEKMMDLQERWEKREAEKAFNRALADFKAEAIEVLKNRTVSFLNRDETLTSYNHAELSGVVESVGPPLSKHGFSFRWDVKQDKAEITVTCILKHALGHSESVTMSGAPDASGKKNTIQQTASTVTYLQRYTLKAITGVAEKGQDNDGRGATPDVEAPAADATPAQQGPATWPDDKFEEQFARYAKAIEAGLKTHADIVALASSKGALTAAQSQRIQAVKAPARAAA